MMIDKAYSILFDKELLQKDRKKINPEDGRILFNFTWISLRWPIEKRLHYDIQLDFNKNNQRDEIKYGTKITLLNNIDKLAHKTKLICYPFAINMDGNVTERIEKDKDYKFTREEVIKFGIVEREFNSNYNKNVYPLRWVVNNNLSIKDYKENYILDGNTGEVLKYERKPAPSIKIS